MTSLRPIPIFALVWVAMIATGFWEAYVEGRNAFDRGKCGPKLRIGRFVMTGYHFFLFFITFPALLSLPLIICGWDKRLFGIILSAYLSGTVLEDFTWFVVNPEVRLSEFGPIFCDYYPWIKLGKIDIPVFYVLGIAGALVSWAIFWR